MLHRNTSYVSYYCQKTVETMKGGIRGALGGTLASVYLSALICAENTNNVCFANAWLTYSAPICIGGGALFGVLAATFAPHWCFGNHRARKPHVVIQNVPQATFVTHMPQSEIKTETSDEAKKSASLTSAANSGLNLFPAKQDLPANSEFVAVIHETGYAKR